MREAMPPTSCGWGDWRSPETLVIWPGGSSGGVIDAAISLAPSLSTPCAARRFVRAVLDPATVEMVVIETVELRRSGRMARECLTACSSSRPGTNDR